MGRCGRTDGEWCGAMTFNSYVDCGSQGGTRGRGDRKECG